MATTEMSELVKVNLPDSQESYEHGNGEGCFARLIGAEACEAYWADAESGDYQALLDNDSWYYPGLKHGTTVPVEMRGRNRPVVPLKWLQDNYGPAQR